MTISHEVLRVQDMHYVCFQAALDALTSDYCRAWSFILCSLSRQPMPGTSPDIAGVVYSAYECKTSRSVAQNCGHL